MYSSCTFSGGTTMRLKYLTPLLLTALAPVASLAAPAEIYGKFHFSADYLNADAGDPLNPLSGGEAATISSNSSCIGFRGDTEINDSLVAFWQLEIGRAHV